MSKFSLCLTYSTCKNAKRKPQKQKINVCQLHNKKRTLVHQTDTSKVQNTYTTAETYNKGFVKTNTIFADKNIMTQRPSLPHISDT